MSQIERTLIKKGGFRYFASNALKQLMSERDFRTELIEDLVENHDFKHDDLNDDYDRLMKINDQLERIADRWI